MDRIYAHENQKILKSQILPNPYSDMILFYLRYKYQTKIQKVKDTGS